MGGDVGLHASHFSFLTFANLVEQAFKTLWRKLSPLPLVIIRSHEKRRTDAKDDYPYRRSARRRTQTTERRARTPKIAAYVEGSGMKPVTR